MKRYLITSNPNKYNNFTHLLEKMKIQVYVPSFDIPELQSLDLSAVVKHKANYITTYLDGLSFVDDSALFMNAYPGFPGAMTKHILNSLGSDGFQRLLIDKPDSVQLECCIGCMIDGQFWSWSGSVKGVLQPRRLLSTEERNPLNHWFKPEDGSNHMDHRSQALQQLEQDQSFWDSWTAFCMRSTVV